MEDEVGEICGVKSTYSSVETKLKKWNLIHYKIFSTRNLRIKCIIYIKAFN
jgi:hypothetical protein